MLLQTNSYVVPAEKRTEHARLLQRFRHCLGKLGCDQFECYEQTGANWSSNDSNSKFVQIMRFRDRKHQLQVQQAEKTDPQAQALIKEFCELINFPYQQQQGYFAVGFYTSVLPVAAVRVHGSSERLTDGTAGENSGSTAAHPSQSPTDPDLQQSDPDSEVANADFGDLLELDDKDVIEGDDPSSHEPQSTSDDSTRQ